MANIKRHFSKSFLDVHLFLFSSEVTLSLSTVVTSILERFNIFGTTKSMNKEKSLYHVVLIKISYCKIKMHEIEETAIPVSGPF